MGKERRRLLQGSYMARNRTQYYAGVQGKDIREFEDFYEEIPEEWQDRWSEPLAVGVKLTRRTKEEREADAAKEASAPEEVEPRYWMNHHGGGRYNVYDRQSETPEVALNEEYIRKGEALAMVEELNENAE
jgi:hypothetical protein